MSAHEEYKAAWQSTRASINLCLTPVYEPTAFDLAAAASYEARRKAYYWQDKQAGRFLGAYFALYNVYDLAIPIPKQHIEANLKDAKPNYRPSYDLSKLGVQA